MRKYPTISGFAVLLNLTVPLGLAWAQHEGPAVGFRPDRLADGGFRGPGDRLLAGETPRAGFGSFLRYHLGSLTAEIAALEREGTPVPDALRQRLALARQLDRAMDNGGVTEQQAADLALGALDDDSYRSRESATAFLGTLAQEIRQSGDRLGASWFSALLSEALGRGFSLEGQNRLAMLVRRTSDFRELARAPLNATEIQNLRGLQVLFDHGAQQRRTWFQRLRQSYPPGSAERLQVDRFLGLLQAG